MPADNNILELLDEQSSKASKRARRALILQGGAIGDCILTLPLACYIKESLDLGAVDFFGRTDYIGIFPGRTCVDSVRSLDSIELHRLFANSSDFELSGRDCLAEVFCDYSCIISFLGHSGSDFEKNLIYTVNSSRSAEVVTLPLKPDDTLNRHITQFYISRFSSQCSAKLTSVEINSYQALIKPLCSDTNIGRELLLSAGFKTQEDIIVIGPGSGGINKCWNLANFISIAKQLKLYGFNVLFLLGPAEMERFKPQELAAMKETCLCLTDLSLQQVLAVLSCSDVFIGNDSGITHLAAALGIKTFALFGPTNPIVYRPLGPDVTVFEFGSQGFAERPCESQQLEVLEALTQSR
ncbi:MAG: glycosyltransferase family 9 protein [Phycisphaerae bacterium]